MRGKRQEKPVIIHHLRITPAHAGKTVDVIHAEDSDQDHPRACGENWMRLERIAPLTGSPPRMRGKL